MVKLVLFNRPIGIFIFGIVLIVTSIIQLKLIAPFNLYADVNSQWQGGVLLVRYGVSYLLRIVGLIIGIGLFSGKEIFRKMAIGLGIFTISTIFLRHTFQNMLYFTKPIYEQHGSVFSLEMFTWIAVSGCWFIDGVFALSLILYCINSKVVKFFKQGEMK